MGTRSKIIIQSQKENTTATLYKHWDGYPSGTLPLISAALKKHNPISVMGIVLEAQELYDSSREDMLEFLSEYNFNFFDAPEYPLHGDLEFIYILDIDKKTLGVYGADGDDIAIIAQGPINPLNELLNIKEEYKEETQKALNESMQEFKDLGFTFLDSKNTYNFKAIVMESESYRSKCYGLENELKPLRLKEKFLKELVDVISPPEMKKILTEVFGLDIKTLKRDSSKNWKIEFNNDEEKKFRKFFNYEKSDYEAWRYEIKSITGIYSYYDNLPSYND